VLKRAQACKQPWAMDSCRGSDHGHFCMGAATVHRNTLSLLGLLGQQWPLWDELSAGSL